jgi:hypothetical protein
MLQDVAGLLAPRGLLYLSAIEGEHNPSGTEQTSSQGLKMVVYYYGEAQMNAILSWAGFDIKQVFKVPYVTSKGTLETHLIYLAYKKA